MSFKDPLRIGFKVQNYSTYNVFAQKKFNSIAS